MCVYVLLLSSISWYKSLILEISINGRNSLRNGFRSLLSSSWLEEFQKEGYTGSFAPFKYIKLAAYRLISEHDPSNLFLCIQGRLPLLELHISAV